VSASRVEQGAAPGGIGHGEHEGPGSSSRRCYAYPVRARGVRFVVVALLVWASTLSCSSQLGIPPGDDCVPAPPSTSCAAGPPDAGDATIDATHDATTDSLDAGGQ